MAQTADVNCADLGDFMNRLTLLRRADDAIILSLNNELPTRSFPDCKKSKQICEKLKANLDAISASRAELIRRCTGEISERLAATEETSQIRPMRTLLRQIRSEADVEQIVNERSQKAVHERCDRLL